MIHTSLSELFVRDIDGDEFAAIFRLARWPDLLVVDRIAEATEFIEGPESLAYGLAARRATGCLAPVLEQSPHAKSGSSGARAQGGEVRVVPFLLPGERAKAIITSTMLLHHRLTIW